MSLPTEEDISDLENNVYRRSLDLLSDHVRKVQDSVRVLANATDTFLECKDSELCNAFQKISVLEGEADAIKGELIEQLTKAAPSLLYREDFLRLVVRVDEIAESCQSISRLMTRLSKLKWIPEGSIAKELKVMAEAILMTYEALRDSILALPMNPRRSIQLVGRVHDAEAKVDEIYHDLDFTLLTEVKQIERLLVFRDLIGLLEHMTDLMEDASDDLRVLALHRVS